MAVTHDVQIGSVRSTVRVDDVPGAGPGVYRVGSVVDGKGVAVSASQKRPSAPLFSFSGLVVIGLQVGWFGLQWLGKGLEGGTLLFGICSWNVIHFSLMVVHDLSGKAVERMNEYAMHRHRILAPWLERQEFAKELTAECETQDAPEQIEAETIKVTALPKKKAKAS